MSARERRIAIDTSVLVNIFTKGKNDEADWLESSISVIEEAERGACRLTLSALVIAELAGNGEIRGRHVPSKIRSRRIAEVREFLANAGYLIVELDHRTARQAMELAINHQLFGPDAVILASAIAAKAETLYTWDAGLLKLNGVTSISVLKPSERPAGSQLALSLAGGS